MGLAKTLKPRRGRSPRPSSPQPTSTTSASGRDRGAGLHQPHADDATFLERERRWRSRATRGSACRARRDRDRRHRLLRAERREGDARRAPAHDDHRRRARAHARALGHEVDPPEPHRRLGHAVRHADRAPARSSAKRRAGEHRRELNDFYARRARSSTAMPRSRSARASASCCCRPATRARSTLWQALVEISKRYFCERLRAARRRAARRAHARRELLQPDAARDRRRARAQRPRAR